MNKFRPHLTVVIALMLLAGPWLQSSDVRASSDETTCGCCCQGATQGCCCSVPTSSEETKPTDEEDGCGCELSDLPAIPTIPMEFHEHRLADKSGDTDDEVEETVYADSDIDSQQFVFDKSPPQFSSRPAYVLFSTFLI